MKINFRYVTLHNFMSFGHSTLTFRDDGFIRVTGINQNPDDLAVSNGSGKSSLWESIVWALTGETIRGTKQVVNINGTDGTYVELEFTIDETVYNIIRSKEHKEYKTNLRLFVDGKDVSGKGIRESEKLLQQFLPDITASLLGSVIILGQGLPQKFTNNTPAGRKEVLEKLSKSDFMIEDLKARVNARKTGLMSSQRQLENSHNELVGTKRYCTQAIQKSQDELLKLDATALNDQYNAAQGEIAAKKKEFEDEQATLNQLQSELARVNEELVTISGKMSQELETCDAEIIKEINKLTVNLNDTDVQLRTDNSELKRLQSIVDVCPTCKQKLVHVEKPDTSALEAAISELTIRKTQLTSELSDKQEQQRAIKCEVRSKYNNQVDLLSQSKSSLTSDLTRTRACIQATQHLITSKESVVTSLYNQLAVLQTTIESHNKTIVQATQEIETIDGKLVNLENEIQTAQQHIDVVNKFETILKRDFRGYLLTNIIDYIESRAKMYSRTIFDTDKIKFELEGNNINISYCGKSYENLSGGEKQKIDLIIQFSIRDMLCNHLGFTSNILVLDEVFDGLDMTGCQRVLVMISGVTDIKNIFIVTHRKDLSLPTDTEIVVVKSSTGISELQ